MRKTICLVAFLALLLSNALFACECQYYESLEVKFAKMDAVFVGRVTKVGPLKNSADNYDVTFEIEKLYKGVNGKAVVVSLPAPGAANCNVGLLAENTRYLVYATLIPNGKLAASMCSGVYESSGNWYKHDVEALDALVAPAQK